MYWLATSADRLRKFYVQRFDPRFWTVNFPRPMMASVVTSAADALSVAATFYNKDDLAGLIWESEDAIDHPLFRYATSRDYRGVTLSFRWQSSNVMTLDALYGPTLTIEGRDAQGAARSWYVRLWNYAEGSNEDAVITLDFDALDGGFLLPAEADPVYAGDIDRMFISFVPQQYDGSSTGPLDDGMGGTLVVEASVTLSQIKADGNTGLTTGAGYVKPHDVAMANGFDDTLNITPERLIENLLRLGYRGRITHYVGMSHYFRLAYDSGEGRFIVDSAASLNNAAAAWHADFFSRAASLGYEVVASLSFEIFNEHMPLAWRQLDKDGNPGLTGWSPPSSLVSPAHSAGMDYLADVLVAFADLQSGGGLPVIVQLGEPWWWVDPVSGAPCFYDAATEALYTSQTGQPVPARHASIYETPDSAQQAYLTWLGETLGAATLALRDVVKAAHASAEVTLLFYTPQVLIDGAPMVQTVNLPAAWASPAFDFLQVEDYDHVIDGDWAAHAADLQTVAATLGYVAGETEYFSGFVLNAGEEAVWANVDVALTDAAARGFARSYVWAFSQVVRDGFTYFTLTEEESLSGFHEVRLSPAIAYGATGGPRFSTQVAQAASGFEQRNANWAQARARYNVGTGLKDEAALDELITFFRARRGKAYGFRFKDWSDYKSGPLSTAVSPVDQVIGTGDGATTSFQLIKTYDSGGEAHARPITKPVDGTVRVAINAAEQASGWSVDSSTGTVTFDTPPAMDAVLQAGFEFDVPVRFDTDALDIALETYRAGSAPDIPIVEIRQA